MELSKAKPTTGNSCRPRWYQFRLRTLLVVTAVICCLLAGPTSRARQQRAVLDGVERVGGRVLFDWENPEMDFPPIPGGLGQMYDQHSGRQYFQYGESPTPSGPAWLRKLIGDEYFQTVTIIDLRVDAFTIEPTAEPINNATLQSVSRLTSLRWLDIDHAKAVDDAGIAHLEALTDLERLFADDVPITDRGLKHLAGLTQLQYLSMNGPHITDEGLKSLRGLKRLKYLYLGNTKITDRGLEHLKELKSLEWLYVPETDISEEAARQLEQSLPNCRVCFSEPGLIR